MELEGKEKGLDFRQFSYYVLENIKWVILVCLACGIIFGSFGYIKIFRSNSQEALGTSIQDIIKKNRAKWNVLDTSVMADAFGDPLPGTYIANAKVYVDFDYSNIEGNNNLDFSDMNLRVQGDIVALALSNESKQLVIDNLNLHSYEDMENLSLDDLRYMASCWFSGSNLLQIQVADCDSERAREIADYLANNLVESVSEYETVDDIRIYEEASIITSPLRNKGTEGCAKGAIKLGVLGLFVGAFLSCGIYLLIFMCQDTIRTDDEIEGVGLKVFGKIPSSGNKKDIELKRMVCSFMLLDRKTYSLVPVDQKTVVDEILEKLSLKEDKREYHVSVSNNILDNPEAIQNIKKNENAILVSTYGKTKTKDLLFVKKELEKAGVNIIGVLLTEVNHCR